MEKIDFFSRAIDGKTPLPSDQAWSRASKKVGPLPSMTSYAEKYFNPNSNPNPNPRAYQISNGRYERPIDFIN